MKKIIAVMLLTISLTGCSSTGITKIQADNVIQEQADANDNKADSNSEELIEETEAEVKTVDYEKYFDGLNGCAVFYNPDINEYNIYNLEMAETRTSPCSTHKIAASILGLEYGVINKENSTRAWSGVEYWNDEWNKDIDFYNAFKSSCIWYFREVVDELGEEFIKEQLNKLEYGNCDISEWEGNKDINEDRSLNGYWLESSLEISPKEQTEVLEKIFGKSSAFDYENIQCLKNAMLIEQNKAEFDIYGKTGTGKINGKTVDSWFTGFVNAEGENIYFAVYLDAANTGDISGETAENIAVDIIASELN